MRSPGPSQPRAITHRACYHPHLAHAIYSSSPAARTAAHIGTQQSADTPVAAVEGRRLQHLQQQLERQAGNTKQPYVPASDARSRAAALTRSISAQPHWSLLHNVWLDNSAEFGHIQLTATLCRLAVLVSQNGIAAADRPEVFKLSGALLSAVQQSLGQFDGRGLAQCLWAYARLQAAAPHSSSSGDRTSATLAATLLLGGHMQQLQPSQLSQAAWAAAALQDMGMVLPAGWWAAVEARMLQLLPLLKPQEVACCARTITRHGRKPSHTAAAALQAHLAGGAGFFRARELLEVLLALSTTADQQQPAHNLYPQQQQQLCQPPPGHGHCPSSSSSSSSTSGQPGLWLQSCYARLQQEAPVMSALDVSQALLALSRLCARSTPSSAQGPRHHVLPVPLCTRLLKRALDILPSSNPRVLVMTAYALGKLGLNPGPWWWARFLPFAAAALHVCSPSMLAVLAWSLVTLRVHPDEGFLQELLQHSAFKAAGFGAQECSMLVWAVGKWHACPDTWWWTAFEASSQQLMPNFTAAELAALLCGMGDTGPPLSCSPQEPQQHQEVQQQEGMRQQRQRQQQWQRQRRRLQQQQCRPMRDSVRDPSAATAAFYIPSGAWSSAMLIAAGKAVSGAPAGDLGGIVMGLAKLGIHPSSSWMDSFEAAVAAALPQASLKDVAAVLWGMAELQAQPSYALVQAVDQRIMAVLCGSSRGKVWAGQVGSSHPPAAAAAVAPAHAAEVAAASPAPSEAAAQLQQWSPLLGPSAAPAPTAAPTATAEGRRRGAAPSAPVAAQLLWSMALLQQREAAAAWVDALLLSVLPSLQEASQATLLVLLRTLAWMKLTPGPRQWMDVWWQAYSSRLPVRPAAAAAGGGKQVAGVDGSSVHSATDSTQQPSQQQPQRLQYSPAAERVCYQLTVVLWCFRRLRAHPSAHTGWKNLVLDATQPLLHQVSAERFSLLLAQLALLHVWPGEAWMAAAEGVLEQQLQHLEPLRAQQTAISMCTLGGQGRAVAS